MTKLDHIAIATSNPKPLANLFQTLGLTADPPEVIPDQGVEVHIMKTANSRLELIVPLSETSPIHRFITKRGNGLHHVALQVDDLKDTLVKCQELGYKPLSTEPTIGAEGKLIIFLDPRTTHGVLIELSQTNRKTNL